MFSDWLTHNLRNRTAHNKLPFLVDFKFSSFKVTTFKEESYNVCRELYEKYGDNLYLSFSGGSDSEYILKCFIELGLPIKPVIVSCPYNQTDIQIAFSYCVQKGITPIVLEYGDEFLDIAREKIYNRGLLSPIGLTPLLVYDYVKDIGGKVISGQGEPLPITNRSGETVLDERIEMYEFEYYMDLYGEDQPQPFYCYNQSIFYTYMKEIDKDLNLDDAKCKLYDIPKRKKTYWNEEIYNNIRNNSTIRQGFKCDFNSKKLLSEMEQHLIR